MASARPEASSRRASGGRGLERSASPSLAPCRRLRVRYGPTTSVFVPAATSFSGSASSARRCSPGVRGSVTSGLFTSLVDLIEQLDGLSRHDGGNGVFVNQLRVTVSAQE